MPSQRAAAARPALVSRSARKENGMPMSAPHPTNATESVPVTGSSSFDDDEDLSEGATTKAAPARMAGTAAVTPKTAIAAFDHRLRLRPAWRASATTALRNCVHQRFESSSGPVVSASQGTTPSEA